jgi:hypothetical protein
LGTVVGAHVDVPRCFLAPVKMKLANFTKEREGERVEKKDGEKIKIMSIWRPGERETTQALREP